MKRIYFLSMAVSLIMGLHSCQKTGNANGDQNSPDLVVVEQNDSIRGAHEGNNYCTVNITIDVPIDGPQVLVDSVMALINKELYSFCEFCAHEPDDSDAVTYKLKENEVFTDDGKNLVSHYMEKYKALIEDSLWNTYFSIELKLEAQTENFVTYGLENYHCGASCGSEKYYFTFNKKDGHQIKDIISHDNLVRFIKEHPECPKDIKEDIGEELWSRYSIGENENPNYGLLNDHFSLVVDGYSNHYLLASYPYSMILPYLSPEAQKLVGPKGENEQSVK